TLRRRPSDRGGPGFGPRALSVAPRPQIRDRVPPHPPALAFLPPEAFPSPRVPLPPNSAPHPPRDPAPLGHQHAPPRPALRPSSILCLIRAVRLRNFTGSILRRIRAIEKNTIAKFRITQSQ